MTLNINKRAAFQEKNKYQISFYFVNIVNYYYYLEIYVVVSRV